MTTNSATDAPGTTETAALLRALADTCSFVGDALAAAHEILVSLKGQPRMVEPADMSIETSSEPSQRVELADLIRQEVERFYRERDRERLARRFSYAPKRT